MKIFITGASGTGKTTLGKAISKEYKIPFITSSAKEIWPKFGFKDHLDAHVKSTADTLIGERYQYEVMKERYKLMIKHKDIITDRSPVDNLAYLLLQTGHAIPQCDLESFIETIKNSYHQCDGLIFVRWNDGVLHDGYHDGYRIKNPHYQIMVDAILKGLILHYPFFRDKPILEIDTWDFSKRIKLTEEWLKSLQ